MKIIDENISIKNEEEEKQDVCILSTKTVKKNTGRWTVTYGTTLADYAFHAKYAKWFVFV